MYFCFHQNKDNSRISLPKTGDFSVTWHFLLHIINSVQVPLIYTDDTKHQILFQQMIRALLFSIHLACVVLILWN